MVRIYSILVALSFFSLANLASAANYKFCGYWQYQYDDQGLGEDYLTHSGTFGNKRASRTWAVIERNGSTLWSGYLDASGCATVSSSSGTFKFWMTSAVKSTNNAYIHITPTSTSGFRWFSKTWNLNSGGTHWSYLGSGDTTASTAAIAVQMTASNSKWTPGVLTKVYTELSGFEGYYQNDTVHLGTDEYTTTWVSRLKTVVAHELGHAIQYHLFGFPVAPQNQNASEPLCKCDHIDHPGIRSHCMQSREHIGFAQQEGFAQFVAAETFNSGYSSTPKFAYYKEVRTSSGPPDLYPPVVFSAYNSSAYYRWMETHSCTASNAGTELDWMTFFFEIHRQSGGQLFSYTDIANVFKDVCGGSCNSSSTTTTYSALTNAVNARFGSSSTKATQWAVHANNHGVNH